MPRLIGLVLARPLISAAALAAELDLCELTERERDRAWRIS